MALLAIVDAKDPKGPALPFVESAESLRAQAHATDTPAPVLVGVLVVAGIACVLFAGNVMGAASGSTFTLDSPASSSMQLDVDKGAAEGQSSLGGDSSAPALESTSASSDAGSPAEVVVFVSGKVANPGVVVLSEGARVGDAIGAAGGFTQDANTDCNNLARVLVDGEQVHVPSIDENVPADQAPAQAAGSDVGSPAAGQSASGLVNINTATQEELESLPGVGPATAAKIVASREQDGPFSSPDDLKRVSGIGEKKYASLADLICT